MFAIKSRFWLVRTAAVMWLVEARVVPGRHRSAPVLDLIGDDRATQYSRALMMESKSRGVLVPPVKPGDDGSFRGNASGPRDDELSP
jgi:hypothetical protein